MTLHLIRATWERLGFSHLVFEVCEQVVLPVFSSDAAVGEQLDIRLHKAHEHLWRHTQTTEVNKHCIYLEVLPEVSRCYLGLPLAPPGDTAEQILSHREQRRRRHLGLHPADLGPDWSVGCWLQRCLPETQHNSEQSVQHLCRKPRVLNCVSSPSPAAPSSPQ